MAVEVVLEFDNIENIKKGDRGRAAALALLPEPTIRQEGEAGTLLALRAGGCRLVRPLGIIHRRQKRPGTATHTSSRCSSPRTPRLRMATGLNDSSAAHVPARVAESLAGASG